MSSQITVRLPDDLVAFMDDQIRHGSAISRAELVARALEVERRRLLALADADIYARSGEGDLEALARHARLVPLDVD
jgi:Arc/MetJ-type ribon-helix-helix transcriptional regulator